MGSPGKLAKVYDTVVCTSILYYTEVRKYFHIACLCSLRSAPTTTIPLAPPLSPLSTSILRFAAGEARRRAALIGGRKGQYRAIGRERLPIDTALLEKAAETQRLAAELKQRLTELQRLTGI